MTKPLFAFLLLSNLTACTSEVFVEGESPGEGVMELLATNGLFRDLTIANGNVYVAEVGEHSGILRCSTDGCADGPTQIVSGDRNPRSITSDSTQLYWTDTPRVIHACSFPECDDIRVIARNVNAEDLAVNNGSLYMASPSQSAGGLLSCSVSNCIDEGPVVMGTWDPNPYRVSAIDGSVFFSSVTPPPSVAPGAVAARCDADGCEGSRVDYVEDARLTGDILGDGEFVYFAATLADSKPGVWRCPERGCTSEGPTLLLASWASFVAIDSDRVFIASSDEWADSPTEIISCPKSGCDSDMIVHAAVPNHVDSLHISDDHIFWIDSFDGSRVFRATK